MGLEERYQSQEYGRIRITTDVKEITTTNVRQVLMDTYNIHLLNRQRIKYLLMYEKGQQPILNRQKPIRSEINVKVVDNVASEITNYKTGYKWGNPITYKQRGNVDISGSKQDVDNEAISSINEMLNEIDAFAQDAELGYHVEVCGVGYQLVDIKKDYDGVSVFDLITLSPLTTYIVYDNTVYHRPLMGVTYTTDDMGNLHFTCLTKDRRYEILNFHKMENGKDSTETVFGERSGEANPMKEVNIVEFVRSSDRMGGFEREISAMDALNILESDFCNNVAQDTQSLWWGDNLDLPEIVDEETGQVTGYKVPKSGSWILTSSGENKKAAIEPLVIQTQYEGILSNIRYQRDVIKQKCFVPVNASLGGGSTGTAMSMASGWEGMEVQAQKEESFMRQSKMKVARLILTAAKESTYLPKNSQIYKLKISDIQPNILRDRNYDMATKANTLATLLNCGIDPKDAIGVIKLFSDVNLVVSDSKEYLDLYYDAKRAAIQRTKNGESSDGGDEAKVDENGVATTGRNQQDASDQSSNSPFIGGSQTSTGGRHEAGVNKRNT